MDLKQTLFTLVNEPDNRRNISRISRDADVPFWPLYRWARGKVSNLDVCVAHKVYKLLTGEEWKVEGGSSK